MRAVSSFDRRHAVTPRSFVRLLGRSSVARCRTIAAKLCHLGRMLVRAGGPLVRLGGALERLCSTRLRRLGCISGAEGALARLPVPMPEQQTSFAQPGRATTGRLPSLTCLRRSRRGGRTRLHGEACASLLAFSQPQTLDLDNLNTGRVNEDDQGFAWPGQRPALLALPEILARPLRAIWLNDPHGLSGMKVTIGAVRHFRCHDANPRRPAPSFAAQIILPPLRGVVTRFG